MRLGAIFFGFYLVRCEILEISRSWCGASFFGTHRTEPTGFGAWIPGQSEINTKTHLSCIDGDLLKTGKFIYSEKVKLNYTSAESFCSRLVLQILMPQSIEENDQPEF